MRKVHLRDNRLFVNAGTVFPACYATAKVLDLVKASLPTTAMASEVTCGHCCKLLKIPTPPQTIGKRKEQRIVNEWAALLRSLKADIADDYRATDDPEDSTPGMLVTFGLDPQTGKWGYQTGDNSFTGGAYSFPVWGLAYLYRRSNAKETAREAMSDAMEQAHA